MKNFILKSTALTVIVIVLGALLYSSFLKKYFLQILPFAVIFFYIVTNLVHAYLLRIADKSGSKFTAQYMAVSFLKMFFYLAVAIGYVAFNRDQAKTLLINFLFLYIVYTTFEVIEFTKVVRRVSK